MFALQNWYCAASSEELGDRPLGRRIAKQDLVLYRDSDAKVQALEAMCAHRGANLALGRVVDGQLQCPWHGWRYGSDGACRLIPSVGENGKIPRLAKVSAYPVHEAQGFIYVWMNPQVQPDWLPHRHTFFDARYHVRSPGRVQRGNYVNTMEAAGDDSHVYIAHRSTIGQGMPSQLAPLTNVEDDPDGRGLEAKMSWPTSSKKPFKGFNAWYSKQMLGVQEDSATHDKTFRVELPGLVIHRYVKADGYELVVYVYVTPVDEQNNLFFAGFVDTNPKRSLLSNLLYAMSLKRVTSHVFDEDEDMISTALSDQYPGGHPRPVSVNADLVGLGFRRMYARQVQAEGFVPAWPVVDRKERETQSETQAETQRVEVAS